MSEPVFAPPELDDWIDEVDKDTDPVWLVKDFLLYDGAHQITGPATRGQKTWFAFALALVVATGKPWRGLVPHRAESVLILEAEGPRRSTADRFKRFRKAMDLPPHDPNRKPVYFAHRRFFYLDYPVHAELVANFVKEKNIKLIIIDTLAKSFRGDENSVRDISNGMRGIDLLRANGAAVVWLHHVGKPSENRKDIDDETRGSSALNGFYDVHLAVRLPSADAPYKELTRRSNEAPEKYFRMEWTIADSSVDLKLEETQSFDEVPDSFKDICFNKLLPFETYNLKSLGAIWGQTSEQVRAMAESLCGDGVLEKVGKTRWRVK